MSDPGASPRTLVLVDGEHYPPVVRSAVEELRARGLDVVGAALLGGTEKLRPDEEPEYGVPVVGSGDSPLSSLRAGIEACSPDLVFDLAGHPVVDARRRMRLAAHTLLSGASYEGADFRFDPPPRPRVAQRPSVAVVGTAKRSGKTAVAGYLARLLVADGYQPLIVTMGRGGPPEPEVIEPSAGATTAGELTELARAGRHAASDHVEDALTARVTTIGTRRAGGGLAGAPVSSTFVRGVEMANARTESPLIFEGSGAALPPVHADATLCVIPASADPELVTGYLGAYTLLLADLLVVTLTDQSPPQVTQALEDWIRELVPGTPIVYTTFRPRPLESISGRPVFFATTAPPEAVPQLIDHLEADHGARVKGHSSNLADRKLLAEDLSGLSGAEVLVTELKAAAVDVAAAAAIECDMQVVFCDNEPVTVGGTEGLDDRLRHLAGLATERFGH